MLIKFVESNGKTSLILRDKGQVLLESITVTQRAHIENMFKDNPDITFEEIEAYLTPPKEAEINFIDNTPVEVPDTLDEYDMEYLKQFISDLNVVEGKVYGEGVDTYPYPKAILDILSNREIDSDVKYKWVSFWENVQSAYASGIANDICNFVIKHSIEITDHGMLLMYRRVTPSKSLDNVREYVKKTLKKSLSHYGMLNDKTVNRYNQNKYFELPALDEENMYFESYHHKGGKIALNYPYSQAIKDCDFSRDTCSRGLHWASKESTCASPSYGDVQIKGLVHPSAIVSVPYTIEAKLRCFDSLPLSEDADVDSMAYTYSQYFNDKYSDAGTCATENIREINIKLYKDYMESAFTASNTDKLFEEEDDNYDEDESYEDENDRGIWTLGSYRNNFDEDN